MVGINQRREALKAFLAANPDLKKAPWERAAHLSEGTIRGFLKRAQTMTDETYQKLAEGASELLARRVTPAELMGERRTVAIRGRIGAGDTVYAIESENDILDIVEAPIPNVDEALQVDGDSMKPLYGPRDLLFPLRNFREPGELVGRIVAAQIKDGPRVVKLLRKGSHRNRWHLVSVNEVYGVLENQAIEHVALIGAAIYHE